MEIVKFEIDYNGYDSRWKIYNDNTQEVLYFTDDTEYEEYGEIKRITRNFKGEESMVKYGARGRIIYYSDNMDGEDYREWYYYGKGLTKAVTLHNGVRTVRKWL